MKKVLAPAFLLLFVLGCAMFGTWRAIPPPGGCDRCHTGQISADWRVTLAAATIHDETVTEPWQHPESVILEKPESPLDVRKITEERCFRCHKEPDLAHREFRGRYHH
jgi:hypothetical protein